MSQLQYWKIKFFDQHSSRLDSVRLKNIVEINEQKCLLYRGLTHYDTSTVAATHLGVLPSEVQLELVGPVETISDLHAALGLEKFRVLLLVYHTEEGLTEELLGANESLIKMVIGGPHSLRNSSDWLKP